jgi:glycosyltransferase involved in cell wall biosynthesis
LPLHFHHVNLQPIVGGGEVYTRALTRALLEADHQVTLYGHPDNRLWDDMGEVMRVVRVADEAALEAALPKDGAPLIVHTRLSDEAAARLAQAHVLLGFAHMPMHDRDPGWLRRCALVMTVSRYCLGLLRGAGLEKIYPAPLYGVADALRGDPDAEVLKRSPYQWDPKKARDVLLGKLAPIAAAFAREEKFDRRPGLTLGLVSMIAPIKQFPLLFTHLAPVLARRGVNLEIFGAGGYAQVRDLRRALDPLGARARFWGHQSDVAAVYPKIDYLMTGLPEKEALGLNVLEAQACGTPVLAPNAPPFTETVLDGHTGYFYADPRGDRGADFDRLLARLKGAPRPDPRRAALHLAQFSHNALFERVRRLVDYLAQNRILRS